MSRECMRDSGPVFVQHWARTLSPRLHLRLSYPIAALLDTFGFRVSAPVCMNNREVWTARRWAPQRVLFFFFFGTRNKTQESIEESAKKISSSRIKAAVLLLLLLAPGRLGINYARPSGDIIQMGLPMNAFIDKRWWPDRRGLRWW